MAYVFQLLNQIKNDEISLPGIQREFTWDEDKIVRLMDSIMRGYPIGLLTLWETYDDIQYRHFSKEYHEDALYDFYENSGKKRLTIVLDGQQRLQSLYIALYGQYEHRELYFDVLSGDSNGSTEDVKYEFWFETEKEIVKYNKEEAVSGGEDGQKEYFARVSDIYNMDIPKKNAFVKEVRTRMGLADQETAGVELNVETLINNLKMNDGIVEVVVLDRNEPKESPSRLQITDILEIFFRINREGTPLSRSDLIFSLVKLNWSESSIDLPKFVQEINDGNRFNFDKDFVIKCLFTVCDFGPRYDVDLLRHNENLEKFKANYDECCEAIRCCIDFVTGKCGLRWSGELRGNLMLIPFVYYFFHLPKHHIEPGQIPEVRRFLFLLAFNGALSKYADSRIKNFINQILSPGIKNGDYTFPLEEGLEFLASYDPKNIEIGEYLLNSNQTLTLSLVQKNSSMKMKFKGNVPEKDHIFPKAELLKRKKSWAKINHYANLWFLEEHMNRNKTNVHPKKFFAKVPEKELKKVFIRPDLLDDYGKFDEFLEYRSKKIINQVKEAIDN